MLLKHTSYLVSLLFVCLSLWHCGSNTTPKADDKVLAQVYNKVLYQSNLADMIPEYTTPEDSALIVKAYLQRWIREQLLMYEAERNIPKDLNIDQLVRDYMGAAPPIPSAPVPGNIEDPRVAVPVQHNTTRVIRPRDR